MEKETTISTNIDKTGENQQVVKGSESTAANNDCAANIEEIQRINRQIGQRIADIREKAGMNQADFYSLLYPNSREAPGTKNNRMGDIENARAFDGNDKKGKLIIDFARLLFISQRFHVPLDYLLYGKTEQTAKTAPTTQKSIEVGEPTDSEVSEKTIETKRISDARDYISQFLNSDNEIDFHDLTYFLLSNDEQAPIMQISAAILRLFNYANISIVNDYELDNFQSPQPLIIKILPKKESVKGYTFWDIRATIIQRLLAMACKYREMNDYEPHIILMQNLCIMAKLGIELYFDKKSDSVIFLGSPSKAVFYDRFFYALQTKELYLASHEYKPQDPMFYVRSCPTDKVPAEL